MSPDCASFLVPVRIQEHARHVLRLAIPRLEVFSDLLHSDSEKITLLLRGTMLLCDVQILNLCDRLVHSDNVNLCFIPHLTGLHVLPGKAAWLPLLFVSVTSSAKHVAIHLLCCKCLPQICGHAELAHCGSQVVALLLCPFGNGIVRFWGIFRDKYA